MDNYGVIVGALAKMIMPGDDPGGFIVTILIGIAGAFVGGFIGSRLGIGDVTGFNFGSIGIATGGAILLLFGYRRIKKNLGHIFWFKSNSIFSCFATLNRGSS